MRLLSFQLFFVQIIPTLLGLIQDHLLVLPLLGPIGVMDSIVMELFLLQHRTIQALLWLQLSIRMHVLDVLI